MPKWIRKISSKLFYRLLYAGDPVWDTGITPPEVMAFLETHAPGRAIDLGCGTGTNVITLAQHGWEAKGVDFVGKAVRTARHKAQKAGVSVTFTVGDVSRSEHFSGQYDLILDIGCYHALSQAQRTRYRQNVAEHLAPGGSYMLYTFTSEDGSRFSPQDLAAFQEGLQLTHREDSFDNSGPTSSWLWFAPQSSNE